MKFRWHTAKETKHRAVAEQSHTRHKSQLKHSIGFGHSHKVCGAGVCGFMGPQYIMLQRDGLGFRVWDSQQLRKASFSIPESCRAVIIEIYRVIWSEL